ARKATAAKVVMRSALAVDPRLHVLRQLHCLVSLVRNSSSGHGFSGAAGSVPKSSLVTPSANVVMAVTVLPVAFSARSTSGRRRGLGGLRRLGDRLTLLMSMPIVASHVASVYIRCSRCSAVSG